MEPSGSREVSSLASASVLDVEGASVVGVEGGLKDMECEGGKEDNDADEGEDGDIDDEEGEEEEEEEGEEEEDNLEEGEYTLRFEGEMNPLDFVEDDAFGVQPYQQFERLEYEALAERKRKALADRQRDGTSKKSRHEDNLGASIDEIMEVMTFGMRRKSRKHKKRGRRKGSRNKLSPEVTRKLGDATLHYAFGRYEEAICVLKEVILLAPNLPDPYHTLGLVYNAIGDKKKALNFYMIAAHLSPKDPSLWKLLVSWSIEQGNTGQARYCLSKAITADPEDISLKFDRATLHIQLGDYQKAAESYEQILGVCPENVEARNMAAKMYQKCGQVERAVSILEDYIKDHPTDTDWAVVNVLASIHMETNSYAKALQQIENIQSTYSSEKEFPLHLIVRAGICNVHLGNMENAEILFRVLEMEHADDQNDLIIQVADTYMNLGHHESALKYYFMLEKKTGNENGNLYLKIAQCYLSLKDRVNAINFFYKALPRAEDNIDARLTLASLLLEEGKEDEAITLLSPPKELDSSLDMNSVQPKPWWLNGKVKVKLCRIYHAKGMLEEFIDAISSVVRETLFIETMNQKVRIRKRLSRSILFERAKVLNDHQPDNVFCGFKPIASTSDLLKAARAKKSLQKKAARKEEKKAAILAAGLDWQSDDSDDEFPQALREPPLPKLLRDEEHYRLIVDLCKALATLRRYWEALEIINHTLKLAYNMLSIEKKEELRSLGAQVAYNTRNPTHGYDCARYIVQEHPYSLGAWNCYYKVISRMENRFSRHAKFLRRMRSKHKDCVPPMLISGHQLTMVSQHQAAAREYLEAYKLQPDSPLINLCVGTALINLALGLRLQNKHQCLVQGFAFLHNNLRLCENSQESLYNVARAYQHVGLVTLASSYYEKVLTMHEKDFPIPKLPNEDSCLSDNQKPGYCNLRREAAYNLHLIYKRSGALDLARQVLKDHCTP
ncbi:PREDICTED: general transcription factor 3C polypeptide 3 isoform X2 [Nelumbo nucifera]|uniref:General transcription factor 3C polypeptide 3 isoform X2 n=1 Tax=Nelumbo nucifera TaxID=4432 RepID=A0A1U7ZKV3_NELNU|nr:PREDICTED: general transcription factor 3C polypeptide 3 isoform X2 [Nelumbo nucifera]